MARGGKRDGAGRKKGQTTQAVLMRKVGADEVLRAHGEKAAWLWLLATAKRKMMLTVYGDVLKYLTDRRDGRPKQALTGENGGPVEIRVLIETVGSRNGHGG